MEENQVTIDLAKRHLQDEHSVSVYKADVFKLIQIIERKKIPLETVVGTEWVAVEDKLPEEHEDVLVYYHQPSKHFDNLFYITQSSYYDEKFETENVTHWMPLLSNPEA